MSSIKLITFDLDDTLWDTKPALINAEIATRDWLEQRIGVIEWGDMNSFLDLRSDLVSKDPSLDWDIGKLRKEIYRSKLESHIPDAIELDSIIEDSFNFHFEKRHELTFYDGALEALEYLSTKYHLGVLTNGNADINKLEIDKYFKFSISSKDVKSNKPSSGHFDEALRLSNLQPNEVLHIGDHQVNDMRGALNAGFNVLWFNKNDDEWAQDFPEPASLTDWYNHQIIENI
jgi:putative hydrolase of the HAD superfamily